MKIKKQPILVSFSAISEFDSVQTKAEQIQQLRKYYESKNLFNGNVLVPEKEDVIYKTEGHDKF